VKSRPDNKGTYVDALVKKVQEVMSAVKKGSWKTTLSGLGPGVAVLLMQLSYLIDGNPATVVDFSEVAVAIGVIFVGLSARDNSVSSEQAGAK
jgi:hypothetical protein